MMNIMFVGVLLFAAHKMGLLDKAKAWVADLQSSLPEQGKTTVSETPFTYIFSDEIERIVDLINSYPLIARNYQEEYGDAGLVKMIEAFSPRP